jgi:hypothetical protein
LGPLDRDEDWQTEDSNDARSAAVGDWDGDGDLDFALGNAGEPAIQIYRNETVGNGDLRFEIDLEIPWPEEPSAGLAPALAFGDADGDGSNELLVGWPGGLGVELLRGPAWGLAAGWSPVDAARGRDVAWGDVDGDGRLDLGVASDDGATHVYRNGDSGFGNAAWWVSEEGGPSPRLAWGDADADGDLDLAVVDAAAGDSASSVRVYRNDGGIPGAESLHDSLSDANTALAWADWDGDGDPDLLTATIAGAIRFHENRDGALLPGVVLEGSGEILPAGLAPADVDGDGLPDLGVACDPGPSVVFMNRGLRSPLERAWVSAPELAARVIAWVDLDGDGDRDLFLAPRSAAPRVFENQGGVLGAAPMWSSGKPREARAAEWGDWDADGDADLALASADAGLEVYADPGDGGGPRIAWRAAGTAAGGDSEAGVWDVAWGDADGDGDLDLAVADSSVGAMVYVNNRNAPPLLPQNPTLAAGLRAAGLPLVTVPGATAAVLREPLIELRFELIDPEGDPAARVELHWAPAGGGDWRPASVIGPTRDLATSAGGATHSLLWDAAHDGAEGEDVVLRLQVRGQRATWTVTPWQRASSSTRSPPIRLRRGCFPVDADGDGSPCDSDCDDADPGVSPERAELCDGRDGNCDGVADNASDADGDGVGPCQGDCDDADPAVHPGAVESCDDGGADRDCDGTESAGWDDPDCWPRSWARGCSARVGAGAGGRAAAVPLGAWLLTGLLAATRVRARRRPPGRRIGAASLALAALCAGRAMAQDPAPRATLLLEDVPVGSVVRVFVDGDDGSLCERQLVAPGPGLRHDAWGIPLANPLVFEDLPAGSAGVFVEHPVLGSGVLDLRIEEGASSQATFPFAGLEQAPALRERWEAWRASVNGVERRRAPRTVLGLGASLLLASSAALAGGALTEDLSVDRYRQDGRAAASGGCGEEAGGCDAALASAWASLQASQQRRDRLIAGSALSGALGGVALGVTFGDVSRARRALSRFGPWEADAWGR